MISVVVPAFNEARVIRACLKSLREQDYAAGYEIIVVDNNSHDDTAQIAAAEGVRVVACPRQGVAYARQAGAEAANGQIIVQADADTTYPKWWLSRIKRQFDRHPRAVAVAGTFVYQERPWWAVFEFFLRVFFNHLSTLTLGRPYIISGANLAFKKSAFVQIGGYDAVSYSADQYNIATRLSKVGKVIYDRRSWGATSARSVAKPTVVIFRDFICHLLKFARHVLRGPFVWLKIRTQKAAGVSVGTYLKIVVPALIIAILLYGYFVPAAAVFGKVYSRAATPDKVIALTFDDGPNEPYTSQVLAILEQYNVQATFFLIGANVQLYPDDAIHMLADGDVIGNHTYSHNANHALTFSAYKDIARAEQEIQTVTGVTPLLYRPPHGRASPWELGAVKRAGYTEVLWNITTHELSNHTPDFLAQQIIKKAKPGGIILLHDGYGTLHNAPRANKSDTVEMLPQIIEQLQNEGYTFVTIPQLLNVPAYAQAAQ